MTKTNHIGRVYAVVGALLVLFLAWAAIAAHPWQAAAVDPQVAALDAQRAQVRHDAAEAKRIVATRWAAYEARLAVRRHEISRAVHQRARAQRVFDRRLAVARAHRPVIVRTVYGSSGSGGGTPSYSGGGYSAPSGGSASAPSASAPVASAPPVVSVGAAAPVTATRSS